MFKQCIVFSKAAMQNVYNVYYFNALSMCIFNSIEKQTDFGFIVDALFGYFAYLHNLYTAVELRTTLIHLFYYNYIRAGQLRPSARCCDTTPESLMGIDSTILTLIV